MQDWDLEINIHQDSLGGNFYYTFTPQIKFTRLPKELGIKGRIFSTAGT